VVTWCDARSNLPPARAVGAPALAAQPIRAAGQRAQRVGAALLGGARIMVADGGRQPGQPLAHVGGEQGGVDLGEAVATVANPHLALVNGLPAPPHRIRIGLGDDPLSTCPASRPRVIDRRRGALIASSASTRANTSRSVIRSLRYTRV
jgi:hypothetical protein